jgi:hypothetical protein
VKRHWWVAGLLMALLAVPSLVFAQGRPADDGQGSDSGQVVVGRLVGGSLNSHSITVKTAGGATVTLRITEATRVSMEVDGTVASLAHLWATHQVSVTVGEVPGSHPLTAAFVKLRADGSNPEAAGQGDQQGDNGNTSADFQLPGQDN